MNIIKNTTFDIELSEEDLKKALEYYLLVVHGERVSIKNIKHLVGKKVKGCGAGRHVIPYQEGLRLSCEEKE